MRSLIGHSCSECVGVALLLSETLLLACFHEVVRLRSGTTRRRHRLFDVVSRQKCVEAKLLVLKHRPILRIFISTDRF
ncbi:hypothetical protein [Nostoc sp. DSM 114160]